MKEGKTKFYISEKSQQDIKGPYRARGTGVFYNPQMESARDLTIAVVERYFEDVKTSGRQMKFLDGLAGTGVRGIRLANEMNLDTDYNLILNDGNPFAVELIQKNISLNNLDDRTVTANENLNNLLTSTKFQFIDIDPFGSAVPFFDNAVRGVRSGGLLAVTATDTAPLCGTYPKTCKRRYDAVPMKNEYMHEIGLRILMGAFARSAAKYDLALYPVLLYSMDYYYRFFLKVTKGARKAEGMLNDIGYIIHEVATGERYKSAKVESKNNVRNIGPLWLGKLNDRAFIDSLKVNRKHFGTKSLLKKLCSIWVNESEMPPWHFDINAVSSILKRQPKKFITIQNILTKNNFTMVPTHFGPQGFKTDATMGDLKKLLH